MIIICLNVAAAAQLSMRITVDKPSVASFCGTERVKCVFVFDARLYYIDFGEQQPAIRQMSQASGAMVPVISPDGVYVTYALGAGDMSDAPSTLWLCEIGTETTPIKVADNGYVPRFVQNATVPTIIYSTAGSPCGGKNFLWDGCGSVVKKRFSGTSFDEAEPLWDGGSYQGGLSWNNRYLATAESSPCAYILDLQNAAAGPARIHHLTVKRKSDETDTTVTIQVCNPSVSASRIFTNCMMYYDFSSSAITAANCYHPSLGTWGFHDRVFISRTDGTVLKVFDVPVERETVADKGRGETVEEQWGQPEWSNHPYFAALAVQKDRLWHKDVIKPANNVESAAVFSRPSRKKSAIIRLSTSGALIRPI